MLARGKPREFSRHSSQLFALDVAYARPCDRMSDKRTAVLVAGQNKLEVDRLAIGLVEEASAFVRTRFPGDSAEFILRDISSFYLSPAHSGLPHPPRAPQSDSSPNPAAAYLVQVARSAKGGRYRKSAKIDGLRAASAGAIRGRRFPGV